MFTQGEHPKRKSFYCEILLDRRKELTVSQIRETLAHFSACMLASLINHPAALRQQATYHVELEAVVFLHQTQHKHTETCNKRTKTE